MITVNRHATDVLDQLGQSIRKLGQEVLATPATLPLIEISKERNCRWQMATVRLQARRRFGTHPVLAKLKAPTVVLATTAFHVGPELQSVFPQR